MHVTINTLLKETFQVEVKPTDTIKYLKEKIQQYKGAEKFPVESQKLIYSGKILEDEKTISFYNINQSKCIIVMVTKNGLQMSNPPSLIHIPNMVTKQQEQQLQYQACKPKQLQKQQQSQNLNKRTDAAGNQGPHRPQSSTARSFAVSNNIRSNNTVNSLSAEDIERLTNNIMGLGFDRDAVTNALNVSFNDPDLAVDLLLSDHLSLTDLNDLETEISGSNSSDFTEYLRNHPELQTLADLVRENPHMLSTFLQQMAQDNPQLLQVLSNIQELSKTNKYVNQHQEEFNQLVTSPRPESMFNPQSSTPPMTSSINSSLTAQEYADLSQLKALGFSEVECLQAYLACGKNVQLAADLLLSE